MQQGIVCIIQVIFCIAVIHSLRRCLSRRPQNTHLLANLSRNFLNSGFLLYSLIVSISLDRVPSVCCIIGRSCIGIEIWFLGETWCSVTLSIRLLIYFILKNTAIYELTLTVLLW